MPNDDMIHFETDQIDLMYLELSQFTNARTKDEVRFDLIESKMLKWVESPGSVVPEHLLDEIEGITNA